jgi:hypothetical protein
MDIETAEQTIRDLADELTATLRAMGHEKASVEFWIGARARSVTWFFNDTTNIDRCGQADTLGDAVRAVRAKIADLPDPHAYDADFSGPLFLYSQHAQAAE